MTEMRKAANRMTFGEVSCCRPILWVKCRSVKDNFHNDRCNGPITFVNATFCNLVIIKQ